VSRSSYTHQNLVFWGLVLAALIGVLMLLSEILLPFVAGMVLAYFLDPVADRCEDLGMPRALATTVTMAAALLIFVAVFVLIFPLLQEQAVTLFDALPRIYNELRTTLEEVAPRLIEKAGTTAQAGETLPAWALNVIGRIWRSGMALFNFLSLLFVTPVVAWYLLRDWDRIVAKVDQWLPRPYAEEIRGQMSEIDKRLAGFVRGQAIVCILLAAFYGTGLTALGLDYGLVVGVVAGVISFIPYVGSVTGFVLSMALALVQFDNPWWIGAVALVFIIGQAIEGNFLTPKFVGGRVGLHAVWVILALFAGGALFGFVGILVAVPVAAVIGVLVRYLLQRYLESRYYTGSVPSEEPEP